MIKKRLLGIFLAGLAMFIWGFLYWGAFGSMIRPMKTLPAAKESAVMEALTTTETDTNVYYLPGMPAEMSGPAYDAWMERHKQGPLAGVIFINAGKDPMAAGMMIQGLIHMLVTAFGLALCLCLASDRLPTYGKRVLFVGLIGLITAFWVDVGEIIWMYHPINNAAFNFGYHFSGTFIAGLVLAAFVRKPEQG